MQRIFSLTVILFSSAVSLCQSQMEMNLEAQANYQQVDKELNRIYQSILKEYSSDKEFIKNLKASERLWIKFRDAEMLVKYPLDSQVRDGSVFPTCYYNYLKSLTEQRVTTLIRWIEGEPEGEVCSGSIRIK